MDCGQSRCRELPAPTILDPFMGSGSTAIAAFKQDASLRRQCEIDRRWFDVAVERINRQTGDGPLFDEPEAEPQQAAMAV